MRKQTDGPMGWKEFLAEYNAMYAAKFSKEQNERVQQHFDAAVKTINDEQDAATIRRLLADVFGHRSYMVAEPNYLSEGLR